jgi:hypothetical protein
MKAAPQVDMLFGSFRPKEGKEKVSQRPDSASVAKDHGALSERIAEIALTSIPHIGCR